MSNQLKNAVGRASQVGTLIFTVPANTTMIIGICRIINNTGTANQYAHFTIDGGLIHGKNTPLPVDSAYDAAGDTKIYMTAGQELKVLADTDTGVDYFISYVERPA